MATALRPPPRSRVKSRTRRGRRLHGSGDLAGAQGGDEGRGGDPEAAFACLGPVVVVHHAPEPGEDQQEHQRREDRDDGDVLVPVVAQRLEEEQGGGDEGGPGEQREPPLRHLRGRFRGALGEAGHRGVEGGEAPGGEEDDPAQVPCGADLPGALELEGAVDDVGGEDAAGAEGEELYGPGAQAAGDEEPGEHREHQHVTEWIGDGDRLLGPAHVLAPGQRGDEVDPGQQCEAGGEDQRVEDDAEVAPDRPVADEAEQADGEQRVGDQVQRVGDGREGSGLAEERLQGVVGGVAAHERQVGGGEDQPGPAPGGPVQMDPDEDRRDAAQPDERPQDGVPGGEEQVGDGEERHGQ
ncbi:hypothetical protein [Streptomyces sp. SS]|uniref:hypothetical protein n=1 Tax=Streptomyces sp. SS TaxID=260742 RepID=UPI000FFC1B45|nr:hypothetical protein [Streptomyces sp. SS]